MIPDYVSEILLLTQRLPVLVQNLEKMPGAVAETIKVHISEATVNPKRFRGKENSDNYAAKLLGKDVTAKKEVRLLRSGRKCLSNICLRLARLLLLMADHGLVGKARSDVG